MIDAGTAKKSICFSDIDMRRAPYSGFPARRFLHQSIPQPPNLGAYIREGLPQFGKTPYFSLMESNRSKT